MAKETRTNKDVLLCIEEKVIRHDVVLDDLKTHFDNHIKHHEERDKEVRKHIWALIVVAVGAILTAIGSLIVGIILVS